MPLAVIALGANQGDRLAGFARAARMLEACAIRLRRRSRLYWTRPIGGARAAPYLNTAVLADTGLSPLDLLSRLQSIEAAFGRRGRGAGKSESSDAALAPARALDLDLIFYENVQLDVPQLVLPHPSWQERDFILRALLDLECSMDARPLASSARRMRDRLITCERCVESSWESIRWPKRG